MVFREVSVTDAAAVGGGRCRATTTRGCRGLTRLRARRFLRQKGSLLTAGRAVSWSPLLHLWCSYLSTVCRALKSGLAHDESPGLHDGRADVADFFHGMRLAVNIRWYCCWPGVSHKYLKVTEIEGSKVSPNQTLWPMCCSLQIG